MGSSPYCPPTAAADFGQQRVSSERFGDHGICLCDSFAQHLRVATYHDDRNVRCRRRRPEFSQHGQAGLLW
jgi:hypothetical protein